MPICVNCGSSQPEGAAFCDECGAKLPESPPMAGTPPLQSPAPPPPPTQVALKCPSCGAPVIAGEAFCGNCGAALEEFSTPPQASQPPQPTLQPQPVPEPSLPPTMVTPPAAPEQPTGGLTCPNCGATLEPGSLYCDMCGAPVQSQPATDGAQPQSQPSWSPPPMPSQPPQSQPWTPPPTLPQVPQQQPWASPPAASYAASAVGVSGRLIVQATQAVLPLPAGRPEILIGREDPVSNVFPDVDLTDHGGDEGGVSRRHARILSQGGQFYLEDLNSTNHTYVNQQKLTPGQPHPLSNGDEIRFGQVRLTFRTS